MWLVAKRKAHSANFLSVCYRLAAFANCLPVSNCTSDFPQLSLTHFTNTYTQLETTTKATPIAPFCSASWHNVYTISMA